jgi:cytochrome c biogenesis protein CcmG/thiol:disulfide interchange protein DsbE
MLIKKMNKKFKFLLPLFVFIIAVGFLFVGLFLDPHAIPSPLVGKPAPKFQAPVLAMNGTGEAGKTFNLDEMKGQVWLLNVWASWCAGCREEHPLLLEMAKTGKITTYGLAYKDTDVEAQQMLVAMGNPYNKVITDADGKIGINYGVYGVPETYLIDKQGVIRYKHTGPLTPEVLLTKVVPLLNELQQ